MFKFLIITFVVIYVIARFAGYFFRFAFWLMGKKVEKEFKKQYQQSRQDHNPKQEGDIQIIQVETPKKNKNFSGGDYIDFEEVK